LNSLGSSGGGSSGQQDATKFEVHIRIRDKELFRPGMSVTANIETRYRTNVLAVPIASVTARAPKEKKPDTAAATNAAASSNAGTNAAAADSSREKKNRDAARQAEVVFVVQGDHVNMMPVKIGITDGDYYEIIEGLREEQEVVSGSYRAIKDLEDGKKIVHATAAADGVKRL